MVSFIDGYIGCGHYEAVHLLWWFAVGGVVLSLGGDYDALGCLRMRIMGSAVLKSHYCQSKMKWSGVWMRFLWFHSNFGFRETYRSEFYSLISIRRPHCPFLKPSKDGGSQTPQTTKKEKRKKKSNVPTSNPGPPHQATGDRPNELHERSTLFSNYLKSLCCLRIKRKTLMEILPCNREKFVSIAFTILWDPCR